MNDLSFVDRLPGRTDQIAERRERYRNVLLEGLRQKLKHMNNDGEQAQDYAKCLIQANGDVTEELKEMEVFANSLLLVVALLRKQIADRAQETAPFWTAAE